MKRVLIICAAGMSSSLMAKKATEYLTNKGLAVEVDATTATQGTNKIRENQFNLYLVSPQTKMYFDNLAKVAAEFNKPIVNIPPQAYIPIPMGIEKMARLIEENIG